jgi:hypothetical protein
MYKGLHLSHRQQPRPTVSDIKQHSICVWGGGGLREIYALVIT